MRVIERPAKVVRIRIDEMEEGKNLPGCETIHLTDTTANEVYLQIVKALGIQDQILQMTKTVTCTTKRIRCGMCGDTGMQNGKPCPQIGCRAVVRDV